MNSKIDDKSIVFQVTMKSSPYLVILFLKILAAAQVATGLNRQPQRRPQPQRQLHQRQVSQHNIPRQSNIFRDDISKVRKSSEVFFVNLEDGFFGCQVSYHITQYLATPLNVKKIFNI